MSKIEWCDKTVNVVTGCTPISPGCGRCYARRQFPRAYKHTGRTFADVECHPERLPQLLAGGKPKMIFVDSMGDLFHDDVPFEFICAAFAAMAIGERHTYQVLTKRTDRALAFFAWLADQQIPEALFDAAVKYGIDSGWMTNGFPGWPLPNVWIGASVENQPTADKRIPQVLQCPAAVRFVSYEPALEPIDFDRIEIESDCCHCGEYVKDHDYSDHSAEPIKGHALIDGVDLVIFGGESGARARPCEGGIVHAARSTIRQCREAGVPVFVKQLGSAWARDVGIVEQAIWKGDARRGDSKGGNPDQWPEDLRVREMPEVRR